jgi:Uma2 family endonuclease
MDVSTELVAEMSVPGAGLRRLRMSWEEFLALPSGLRTEWVDGEVVVSPPVGRGHFAAAGRLGAALTMALPELLVGPELGVWLPGNRLRAPDLAAIEKRPSTTTFVEEAPVLVVEVLSPSTRAEDTIRKPPEYAGAGIGQFWVVDPDGRSVDVFENVEGTWELLLHLDDAQPTGEVTVGAHGVVPLDLAWILPI